MMSEIDKEKHERRVQLDNKSRLFAEKITKPHNALLEKGDMVLAVKMHSVSKDIVPFHMHVRGFVGEMRCASSVARL